MVSQRYSVTQYPIEALLTYVKSGEIAIPEIQRPFVWNAVKVRDLLDSLYKGFPIGYLVGWHHPSMRLKDGSTSSGKRILIDGQQRVTALSAALLGRKVLTKEYVKTRIFIAFNPIKELFEVSNPAIRKDSAWIPDLAEVFSPGASLIGLIDKYTERNPQIDRHGAADALERVLQIVSNNVGMIELAPNLDIDEVTKIFVRVNSAGASLSQADFAMSELAADDLHGGRLLRKAIDYFCHAVVAPEFLATIEKSDEEFAASEFLPKMRWLKAADDHLYEPSYADLLRVAFTSQFKRGRLQDLVALLTGRNFETKLNEAEIAGQTFARLKDGVLGFMNETRFKQFTMILHSAGFVSSDLVRNRNAINFAYILYLRGYGDGVPAAQLGRLIPRWYVMSLLRGRYSGSAESTFEADIRGMIAHGIAGYSESVISAELSDGFWEALLPQEMETDSPSSPYFLVYQAAQAKSGDNGFLSRDIKVHDLICTKGDVHHIYPRNYLKKEGVNRNRYNQIANLAWVQTEIDIAIGDKSPKIYFAELAAQCNAGPAKYGAITDLPCMRANLETNCIPQCLLENGVPDFEDFLRERRKLMARKIRAYFDLL